MNRSLAKLAAALLVGAALTGCQTLGIDGGSKSAHADATPAPKKTTSTKSLSADIETQVRAAQGLRAQGDYPGATKILSQLMMVSPDDARVVGEYGKNLVQQGRSKEALDFLRRAVELQPGDWTLYSATGVAFDQNGDYANAKAAYERALQMKPADVGVLNNYALSRMQAGDLAGARRLMAQASTGTDPKIAHNVALLASLTPAEAAPAPMKPQATATAKPLAAASYVPPPRSGTVTMQPILDTAPSKAAAASPSKATSAPRKLAADAPPAPAKTKTATAAAQKPVATAKPVKAASATPKAPAANKTPSLRMTADAATP